MYVIICNIESQNYSIVRHFVEFISSTSFILFFSPLSRKGHWARSVETEWQTQGVFSTCLDQVLWFCFTFYVFNRWFQSVDWCIFLKSLLYSDPFLFLSLSPRGVLCDVSQHRVALLLCILFEFIYPCLYFLHPWSTSPYSKVTYWETPVSGMVILNPPFIGWNIVKFPIFMGEFKAKISQVDAELVAI